MRNRISTFLILGLVLLIAQPAFAGMVPSKTASNQNVEARQADLELVRQVVSLEPVARALEAQGYSAEQVDARLAVLSDEDLRSLANNLEQIQAAGLTSQQWTYVLLGAVVVLILLLV